MMMLAIYPPASWQLQHPPPSPLPDASQPQALPLLAAFGIGDGLGFQPALGYLEPAAAAGWESW